MAFTKLCNALIESLTPETKLDVLIIISDDDMVPYKFHVQNGIQRQNKNMPDTCLDRDAPKQKRKQSRNIMYDEHIQSRANIIIDSAGDSPSIRKVRLG